MKRLPAQIGITCFSVLVIAFFARETLIFVIGGVGSVGAVVSFIIPKARKTIWIPAVALTVLLSSAVSICYNHLYVQPIMNTYSGSHTVQAVLCDEPYRNYRRCYYLLRTQKIDGIEKEINIIMTLPKALEVEPDDTLRFTSQLIPVENDYYRSKGYLLMTEEYSPIVETEMANRHSLYYHIIGIRRAMRSALDSLLPSDTAKLTRTIFLGDKYALDNDTRDRFRYAGASYFIVISGMHFSVICMLIMRLLKKIKILRRWVSLIVMLFIILLYMAVTGFQPSVLRSGLMMITLVIGNTFRRITYPLNHLGVAGIILPVIMSPYGAGDPGLILSFYATLSILLWAEPLADKLSFHDESENNPRLSFTFLRFMHGQKLSLRFILKLLWNKVAGILSVTLAVNILVVPITICLFHELSLITLLSAVILYPFIYLILILALLTCILWCVPFLRWLAIWLSWLLYYPAEFVLWSVGILSSVPYAFIPIHAPFILISFIMNAVVMIAVLLLRRRYKLFPIAVLSSAAIFLSGFLIHSAIELNTLSVTSFETDNGMSVALNSRGHLHLLSMDCDIKDFYAIMNDLSDRYGSVETALCLNRSAYERYLSYSDQEFAIHRYLLYDIEDESADTMMISDGIDCILDDDVTLSVSKVDQQPVMLLQTPHQRVLLLPAKATLSDIPNAWRDADCIISGSQTPLNTDHIKYTCEGGGFTLDLR